MKNFFKILFKCLLLIGFTLFAMDRLSALFRPVKNNQGNNFRGFDEDIFDVIVLGSSHAQYSFNPAVFYYETGNYAYVLGSSCQAVSVSYEYLNEALKTQKPEVVLLEVFSMLPDVAVCRTDGVTKLAADDMSGLLRYRTIWHIENKMENLLEYWFDIIMTHSNWSIMEAEDFTMPKDKAEDIYMGYVSELPDKFYYWELQSYEVTEVKELKEEDLKYLLKIKELCDENEIQLILYKAPYMIDQEGYNALHSLWTYAEANGIEYVDGIAAMEEMDFHLGMDGDAWHNNAWGARKMTEYLSKIISDKGIQSHRQNELAEEFLNILLDISVQSFIQNVSDPYLLLDLAAKYDCSAAIQYHGNPVSVIGEENLQLQAVGFDHDFVKDKRQDYFAVAMNQTLVEESTESVVWQQAGHTLKIDQSGIYLDGKVLNTDSQMTIVILGNDLSWYEVMNIDYSKRFWKKGYLDWYPDTE